MMKIKNSAGGGIMIQVDKQHPERCCGCTACASACPQRCIAMNADEEGFLYPQIDSEQCSQCGICEKVCPILHRPALGTHQAAVALRAKDREVLAGSTSGGSFTPLANAVLKEGGLVFGAAFTEDFCVAHRVADRREAVAAFRGSKYVQSELTGVFAQVKSALRDQKTVLFSGMPCQVAGLKSFLGKEYDNLFCVDLICFGVSSPLVWKKYREEMSQRFSADLSEVAFRKKTYGYHSGTMAIRFSNGRYYTGSGRVDGMLKSFYSKISLRPSCYQCTFKTMERESDLSLFDCWHASDLVENLVDDDRGYTTVLVHSEKGADLLRRADSEIERYPIDAARAVQLDGTMVCGRTAAHPQRDMFYKVLTENTLSQTVQQLIPVRLLDHVLEKSKALVYRMGLLRIVHKIKR